MDFYQKKTADVFTVIAVFVTFIDIIYLGAQIFTKIPHGGYWSLILALVPSR